MPLEFYRVDDELPCRVTLDTAHGAGHSWSDALMAALSVGGIVPPCIRRRGRRAAAQYIFWHYNASHDWQRIIHVLDTAPVEPPD